MEIKSHILFFKWLSGTEELCDTASVASVERIKYVDISGIKYISSHIFLISAP